jgi:hypothetical protein
MFASVCGFIAIGYFNSLDDKITIGVPLAVYVAALIQDGRVKRQHVRNHLDWQIENARRRVAELEAEVRDPQEM